MCVLLFLNLIHICFSCHCTGIVNDGAYIKLMWVFVFPPANCGAVRSLEEVEGEMKGMKLGSDPQVRKLPPSQRGDGTPFMAEHLEEALTGGSSVTQLRDSDMSAFNKLVSSMKASGTLPTHPKTSKNNVSIYL